MTVTLHRLALYALAMAGLWVIPGPVWVALTARALSGGMAAAWQLAVGGWLWGIWSGRYAPFWGWPGCCRSMAICWW